VLAAWIDDTRAGLGQNGELRIARSADEAARLSEPDDAPIAPVRVAWLPPGRDGDRRWRRRDLLRLHPQFGVSARERERILATEHDRCRILVGEAARPSELGRRIRARSASRAPHDLPAFIASQAKLTLDRSERSLTGARYKMPSDVAEHMAGSRRFEDGISGLAADLGRSPADVRAEALGYLQEMASTQSQLAIELWALLAKTLWSRAYDLCCDPAAIKELRELNERHPLVFLPTHKSNLDQWVLTSLLHDNGFPRNHTLGGINFGFWPLGPLGRRVGVIWIRRSIRDNPVYRWMLRQYLGYLVGKRFNLEWYIEGGRTRTGKLLPPKMGLLRYLVDAIEDAGVDDVQIVPVSIVYDQLAEVAEMTAESRGGAKTPEGLRWFVGYAGRQSRASGRVQVRFGEPVNAFDALRAHGAQSDPRLALSKLAFDVCTRINRVTPVTSTGLATLAMLGVEGRSLTAAEVRDVLEPLRRYAEARALPGTDEIAELATVAGAQRTLAALVDHGVLQSFDKGREPVFAIGPENELIAAFHRNTVIHWFVNRSIAELALVRAAEEESDTEQMEIAWSEAFRLRDVLKFEFFFEERDRFRDDMRAELALIDPTWHKEGELTVADVGRALVDSGGLMAHRVLTSFLEAYLVVADCLAAQDPRRPLDEQAFIAECLGVGRQLRLQEQITSGEAVSGELFASALKLADNRGLLRTDDPSLGAARLAFKDELTDLVRRIRIVAQLDRERRGSDALVATAGGA
jgi:glycerol-3-phosphate O-acyltransferase